jgi:putative spermidine/putrescine transport system ATP-binding protein
MTDTSIKPGGRLSIESVSKKYGDQLVLNDVSLDVRPGEFLTLLGPSGSGKTTTLNLVAGFLQADGGRIQLDGRDLSNVPANHRDIGVVFQQYALFPHMTAAENIGFPLDVRKIRGAEKKRMVADALDMVRLGDFADRLPRQMSGGQQQRIALARAFVFKPRLLLMDEPLGALDKKLREVLQIEITKICRELGVTVIYVTHDQEEALVMSDRIAIYNDGRIEQIGSAEELYESPQSLFVADFVGESNVLQGKYLPGGISGHCSVDSPVGVLTAPTPAAAATMRPGFPAAMVVRPERMHVSAAGAVPGGDINTVAGTLIERIYLGLAHKFLVRTHDGNVLTVRGDVNNPDAAVMRPGDQVHVWWHSAHAIIVPAGPETQAAGSESLLEAAK